MSNNNIYDQQYLEAVNKDYSNIFYVPTREVTPEILQVILSENIVKEHTSIIVKVYDILAINIHHILKYEQEEKFKRANNINVPVDEDTKIKIDIFYCAIELLSNHLYYLIDNINDLYITEDNINTLSTIINYNLGKCDNIIDAFKVIKYVVKNINKKSNGNKYSIFNSIKSLDTIHGKYLFFIASYSDDTIDFTQYRKYFNSSFIEYIEEDKKYKQQLDEYVHKDDDELM